MPTEEVFEELVLIEEPKSDFQLKIGKHLISTSEEASLTIRLMKRIFVKETKINVV